MPSVCVAQVCPGVEAQPDPMDRREGVPVPPPRESALDAIPPIPPLVMLFHAIQKEKGEKQVNLVEQCALTKMINLNVYGLRKHQLVMFVKRRL